MGRWTVIAWLCCAIGAACGSDDPNAPRDHEEQMVPASTVSEPGIRREMFYVDGATPPANPDTAEQTPANLNRTLVVRYRSDVDPPAPARAILIASPGFLGGAGAWDQLARNVVRRSLDDAAPVEMWVLDRRANQLEDRRGMDTAEALADPEIAQRFYFGADTIDGDLFGGLIPPDELSFMSEWGLATHVEDVRAVIELIPEAERRGRVFLVGHSLGAFFTEAYAAWRFEDDTRGAEQLAGLVLIEGLLRPDPLTEQEFNEGLGAGFEIIPGLNSIRRGFERYFFLPIFGNDLLVSAEIQAMRASFAPDAVVDDPVRDDAMRILMLYGTREVPPMTNAAALGFNFDDGSSAIELNAVSCGRPTGGPLEDFESPFAPDAMLSRPADSSSVYTWLAPGIDEPGEFTSLDGLAKSGFEGRTNMFEWYFPSRLQLDLAAVGGGALAEDGYQALSGLRVFDGPLNDAPILAISAQQYPVERYAPLPGRIASTIGPGRPQAGATRDMDIAYRIVVADGFTHVDPITATDRPDNPIPGAILEFVDLHAVAGTVAVPPAQ